jgi:MoaA/NifB/PqqE/SkfB family radical SAM enzyme
MTTIEKETSTANDLAALNFLWLEITNQCNLRCVHCYSNSSPYEPLTGGLTTPDWIAILKEAHDIGCRGVQFIGGEPLLHPGLPTLVREARRLNFETVEIYSNTTRLSDGLISLFAEQGVMLATSFYSDDACTHDQITQHPGSYNKTIGALRRAIAAGIPIRVGVITMPGGEQAAHKTGEFLRQFGIENIRIDQVRGFGRGLEIKANSGAMSELCGACWRGRLAIDSAGNVSPCVFSHFNNVGHFSEGLVQILGKPELLAFRRDMRDQQQLPAKMCAPNDCSPNDCSPNNCSPTQCSPYDCSPLCSP